MRARQRGAVALGVLGLLAGLGQPLVEVVEDGRGGLVLGVETLLAGVEAGDPGLEGGEVVLGAVGAGRGVLAGLGRAGRSRRRPRRRATAERVDLAVQPGQALAAVGGGAVQAGDPALLLGRGVLGGAPGGDGLLERGPVLLDLGVDPRLLLAHLRGLGLELVGVAAGATSPVATPSALRTRSAASDWVPRSRSRSPDSANQVSCACASAGRSSRSAASSAASPRGPRPLAPRPPRAARPASTRRRAPAPAPCAR